MEKIVEIIRISCLFFLLFSLALVGCTETQTTSSEENSKQEPVITKTPSIYNSTENTSHVEEVQENFVEVYNSHFETVNSDVRTLVSFGEEGTQIIENFNADSNYENYKAYLAFGERYSNFAEPAFKHLSDFESYVIRNKEEIETRELDADQILTELKDLKESYLQFTKAMKGNLETMTSKFEAQQLLEENDRLQKDALIQKLSKLIDE